jgi:class 3 adenylate cyclase
MAPFEFMTLRIILFTCLLTLSANFGHAQTAEIDSLQTVISTTKDDTLKVNALIELSQKFYSSDPQKAIRFGMLAKEEAEKITFLSGLAKALKSVGIGYYMQSKYLETLEYWQQSLAVYDSIGDRKGVANILNNQGAVYFNQGDDTKALELYLKSLQVSEELGDTIRIVTALSNVGTVYSNKKKAQQKALEYFLKALPIIEAYHDQESSITKDAIGTLCVNIGEVYFNVDSTNLPPKEFNKAYTQNEIDSIVLANDSLALLYFEKAQEAYKNSEDLPAALVWLGKVYTRRKEFSKAITFQLQSYEIAKNLEMTLEMAQAKVGLGDTYFKKGDYKLAINSYKESEELGLELGGSNLELKRTYGGLALSYAKQRDYEKAYLYQTKFTEIKDDLYNLDTEKKLGGLQFAFDIQKKQGQIDLLTKDKALQELDLQRQRVIKNATIGGLSVVCVFLVVVFFQKKKITKEKQRSDELLLNILPSETAEELKATGKAKTKSFDLVSVMFTDFKNFTQASEKLSAEELVQEINDCYSAFDRIVTKYGIEKIKTIGDSYMCAGGLPATNSTHATDVVMAGLEMQEFIAKNKADREAKGQPFFELRLGVHTGPVIAGIVGIKKFAYDIWGDTVNTASRMESSGEVGKVNVSGSTYDIIKDKFNCIHRGKIKAKNKGEIDMYFVEGIKD